MIYDKSHKKFTKLTIICDSCKDGCYLKNYQCLRCDDNCKTCSDSATTCKSCEDGYYLNSNTCISEMI